MTVTVITPTIPSRAHLLAEAAASVATQTVPPVAHLIGVDHARNGTSAIRNQLVKAADTRWIALLDDDDLLYPDHLSVLLDAAEGADIVYPWCKVTGRDWNPNSPFDADRLRHANYIPATTLIRRSLILNLAGWRNSSDVPNGWEDHDFWLRALDAGARFVNAPVVTWEYRHHGGNKTILGEQEAR